MDMHRLLIVDGYDGAAESDRADSTAMRPPGELSSHGGPAFATPSRSDERVDRRRLVDKGVVELRAVAALRDPRRTNPLWGGA